MLNKSSVSIEIDAWGGLKYRDDKWWTYIDNFNQNGRGKSVAPERVISYPDGYRGYNGYEKYTDAQIETTRQLIMFWHKKYGIQLCYNEDMWDLSKNALNGCAGIWTHNSYRPDKSDCHPQKELVKMLQNLER